LPARGKVGARDTPLSLLTIGHSTRAIEEFIELLEAHGVKQLVDVRTLPRSRRYPHFSMEPLAAALEQRGIAYVHLGKPLGGLRKPRADSVNRALTNEAFRGYADHMATEAFDNGIAELLKLANAGRTTIMCAEAVPWRCHRLLLSDALTARGVNVAHILSLDPPQPHELSRFAHVEDGRVSYPAADLFDNAASRPAKASSPRPPASKSSVTTRRRARR
jgi:uncharacterized protein (DUF488 family)